MRCALLFAFVSVVVFPLEADADEAALSVFPSRAFVLANGLDVYLEHDTTRPTVSVVMAYSAGSREDPIDRQGLAHLTEHVTYQGTRDLGEDAMIAALERVGVTEWNGTTSQDQTQYFATAPREAVSSLLWIEAQRMAYVLSHANASTVTHQIGIVQREWFEQVGDHAGSVRASVMATGLFPLGHPYANDSATPREVGTLTLADVQWFHQQFYRPSRARLAVVGDVELDEAERLVRLLFDRIVERGASSPRTVVPVTPSTVDRTIVVRAPVQTTSLRLAWVTPAYFSRYDAEFDVLAQFLCADESSDLSAEIVRHRRIGVRVSCRQLSRSLASVFSIDVGLGDQRDRSAIPIAVDDVLATLVTRPFDEAELETARRRNRDRVIASSRSALGRAKLTASFLVASTGMTRYSAALDLERYDSVTSESLKEAVRYLIRTGRLIVLTLPDPAAPDEGTIVTDVVNPL